MHAAKAYADVFPPFFLFFESAAGLVGSTANRLCQCKLQGIVTENETPGVVSMPVLLHHAGLTPKRVAAVVLVTGSAVGERSAFIFLDAELMCCL